MDLRQQMPIEMPETQDKEEAYAPLFANGIKDKVNQWLYPTPMTTKLLTKLNSYRSRSSFQIIETSIFVSCWVQLAL